jgi:hypothetical protein
VDGALISILDVANQCAVHNVLVVGASSVEGESTGLNININGAFVPLVYIGATSNWKVAETPTVGLTGATGAAGTPGGPTGPTGATGAGADVPKITGITYPSSETAVDVAGGETVTLVGTGFAAGASLLIGTSPFTTVSVVAVVSSTSITFTAPAVAAGTYPVYLVNTDGATAIAVPGISYSGIPAWTTAAGTLGASYETGAVSTTLAATGDAPVTYSVVSGSLPTNITLNSSTGLISGTNAVTASSTTYSFVIKAVDAQNQTTNRSFSITVNPDVVTWTSPADGTAYLLGQSTAMSAITLVAASATGGTISYSADTLPAGVSISGDQITGAPTTISSGASVITAATATTNKTATRTFTWTVAAVERPPAVECLIVAGGGGSSGGYAEPSGGGGAGGYFTTTAVTAGIGYRITIGAGGAGNSSTTVANNGSNSSLGIAHPPLTLVNAPSPNNYVVSDIFTSASANFDFKVQISGTRPTNAGYLGIGLNNTNANTFTQAVEYAQYAAYGTALARKLINYAYAGLAASTPFRLRATKTGASIVFSITDTSDTVIYSETVSLTGGTSYKVFLYYNKDSTNDTQTATILTDTTDGANNWADITAIGGGRGGTGNGGVGQPGGSGGGGSSWGVNAGGAGTSGQGNTGGTSASTNPYPSGGGGGAGAVGGNASTGQGGNGGVGLQSSISGTATYYAGGGAGTCYASGTPGTGGLGGGGNGGAVSSSANGYSGTTNTGGGGGGANNGGTGGTGGSGVVVIRYADSYAAASATTGSPTVTVSGGYRIYTWTGNGSITF